MKVTIQWLKEYVDFSLTPEQLAEQLTDAGIEVVSVTSNPYDSDDFVLELEITANRPDLLSVIGVAREISALTGSPLKEPEIKIIESDPPVETLATVTILAPELCPRYSARVITGVKIGPSPDWLVKRLTAVGVRTINNVVDVTNYVLMEYGHPMHAFDLNCLDGHNIVVRTPYPGETLKTLDEQERLITPEMLVIADGKKPVALAGIMGGANSQVVNSTTDILLESAYFNPVSTRKTASALGLKTEASYRFERGADPEGTIPAVNRGIQLIQKLAGGRIARGIIDVYPKPIVSPTSITLRVSRTNHILGTKLELDAIQDILVRLQLSPTIIDVDTLQVRIPSFRRDISREIDLIEEIARIYGYNRIPTTTPVIHIMPYTDTYHRKTERVIRNQMISAGFYEAVNHSLVDPIEWQKLGWDSTAAISLKNPMSVEQSIVRTSLLPSLLRNLADNIKQGANEVALFELNYVYEEDTNPPQTNVPIKKSNPYRQITNLAAVLYRKLSGQSWNEPFTYPDFYYLKGVIESVLEALEIDSTRLNYHAIQRTFLHSTRAAEIKVGKQSIGLIGQLANSIAGKLDIKKETFLFELNLDAIYNLPKRQRQYQPLPKYPAVIRDVSLLVPNSVSSIQITSLIQSVVKENIAGIELFDVYSGDKIPAGFRSLSYRITYRADDRTLSDEEVNQLNQQVLQTLIETLEIKIR
ncbi:MAG: phenylalanine--tRNA ligase subunit beta [bacterium]|nr:phenylalanine--tRNA ligase subunit beta [bacterium]